MLTPSSLDKKKGPELSERAAMQEALNLNTYLPYRSLPESVPTQIFTLFTPSPINVQYVLNELTECRSTKRDPLFTTYFTLFIISIIVQSAARADCAHGGPDLFGITAPFWGLVHQIADWETDIYFSPLGNLFVMKGAKRGWASVLGRHFERYLHVPQSRPAKHGNGRVECIS